MLAFASLPSTAPRHPLPAIPLARHRFSIADFHRLGESGILAEDARVELIEGELIDMAPIGSLHGGLVKRLARMLFLAVGHDAIVSIQDPIDLYPDSQPQPDLALLRPRGDDYMDSHPTARDVLLLIEVADSSLAYDRDVKLPLYARHAIPEVWLLDPAARCLSRHTEPEHGAWQMSEIFVPPQCLAPQALPQAVIDLQALFR